jgi:hypothetical protein
MMKYKITLKNGHVYTCAEDGNVLHRTDVDPGGQGPYRDWRILGFSKRHNSRNLVSLTDAARGTDIGQGWVHDLDHGTHRMWGHPSGNRAVSVLIIQG